MNAERTESSAWQHLDGTPAHEAVGTSVGHAAPSIALVTGAGGFIGAHLVRALLAAGWRVVALDDLSLCRSWWRLDHVAGPLDRIECDLLDGMALERAARGARVVFHHAGISSAWPQSATLREWHAANATGVLQLLEVARFAGVARLVLSAICAHDATDADCEFGQHQLGFDPVTRAVSESYARYFASHTDLDTAILGYAEVYGPLQLPLHPAITPVASLVQDLMLGNVPLLHGDESRQRDFVSIDDVVSANLLAARHRPAIGGARYAVASGTAVTIRDVARRARQLLGLPADPRFRRSRRRPPFASLPDIAPAREVLDYSPATPFEQGLRKTIAWQQAAWG